MWLDFMERACAFAIARAVPVTVIACTHALRLAFPMAPTETAFKRL
jgi:cation transport ATPase